jgi:hypothetical protein
LPHDHLDVLVVDADALEADLLDLVDQELASAFSQRSRTPGSSRRPSGVARPT